MKRLLILFLVSGLMLAAVPVAGAQTGSDRFPQLSREKLSPEQQRAAAEILKQSSSSLGGPWNIMLRSPDFAERLAKLLDYIRYKTSLPLRLNEFAIMIAARQWSCHYAWWAHHRFAREAGLSEAVMADLAQGKRPGSMKPDESVVYDLSTELFQTHFVRDETFRKAKEVLGEQQVVDVIAACGAYSLLSMLLNTAEVKPDDGSRPPWDSSIRK